MYHSFLIHLSCWWTSRLLPCPGYYKQCCNEHWGTRVSFPSGFLSEWEDIFTLNEAKDYGKVLRWEEPSSSCNRALLHWVPPVTVRSHHSHNGVAVCVEIPIPSSLAWSHQETTPPLSLRGLFAEDRLLVKASEDFPGGRVKPLSQWLESFLK